MSLDLREQKCAVCSAYLFPEDDTVYCPICGAPHHRDCYRSVGHCGMEELHGTDMQYKKPENQPTQADKEPEQRAEEDGNCRICGFEITKDARFCPRCGSSTDPASPISSFSPFGQTVEIKDNTPVAENVTAIEAMKIVQVNPFRYVAKFKTLSEDKKTSWNWAAFLMPYAWFAYRKMYKESIVTTLLMIATLIFNVPFNLAALNLPLSGQTVNNYMEVAQYYSQHLGEIGMLPVILALVGTGLGLIIRIICGIYGDWFYRNRVVYAASKIKEAEDNKEAAQKKYSGISFIAFLIAVAAMEFIPTIIAAFLV